MLIDSHCHLEHTYGTDNINEELYSELFNQLGYLVNISTNIPEILSHQALSQHERALFSYGLYPDQGKHYNQALKDEFESLIKARKPNAIGESGLDYHWDYGGIESQEKLFRDQIETAIDFKLPLIVHSRDAFTDTDRILSGYRFNKEVIIHCFGYGLAEAEKFIARGYTISFAGNLTYPKAKDLHEAAVIIPLDKVLLETDSPYLTPVPFRGKKNQPPLVKHTYQTLAQLKKMDEMELESAVEKNFKRIFDL